jgi:hypothetical protein
MAVRKQYPDFKIRETGYALFIPSRLRKAGISYSDFLEVFPEYKNDASFKSNALFNTSIGKDALKEYVNLFNDKSTETKLYVLDGMTHKGRSFGWLKMQDFIDIFGDREILKNWVLTKLVTRRLLSESAFIKDEPRVKEICDLFGIKTVEDWCNNIKADGRILGKQTFVDYIQCTQNYTKATDMICERLASRRRGFLIGLDIQRTYKYEGIDYAYYLIPYIQGDAEKKRIENAIEIAHKEIRKYDEEIRAMQNKQVKRRQEFCDQCIVRSVKLPDNKNDGKVEMENLQTYPILLEKDGKWRTVYNQKFNSIEEVVNYYVNLCKSNYCD